MQLSTQIDIPKASFEIPHTASLLMLGSCFADEVGERLVHAGFDAMVNPYGTLYNPASIASLLTAALDPATDTDSLIFHDEQSNTWHSWMHHTRFSSTSRDELQSRIIDAHDRVRTSLQRCNFLIITLGTAIIYRLKENGLLVANCHKQPDDLFVRERLTPQAIADTWRSLINRLIAVNPTLRIIFTVSPIRHKRDGMHINQISKGILLQAVDELVESPDNHCCTYFPAYEIMLDELRDYRFYADDMIHPSSLAVEYIWQRFQDTFFSNKTKDSVAKFTKAWKQSQHRTIVSTTTFSTAP